MSIKSTIKKAVKSQISDSKKAYIGVGNAIIGAAKNIQSKVSAKCQTGNALQATTLPGAGKVFTGKSNF